MSPWLDLENQRNLSQLKTVAFAQAAHEFRNPLNGIISSLEQLEGVIANENQAVYYNTALNCSHLMLSLVKDILDFSQIEAKSFILNSTYTNLRQLLEECLSIFKIKALEKNICLEIISNCHDNFQLYIDESRLKQIIINLLSNAIKYTEKGFVKINTEQRGSQIIIAIQDSGVGMTEAQICLLFQNFTKFMKNRHMNKEGVGLGLTISQNIAKALGGNINVHSLPGAGSTFILSVPFSNNQNNLSKQQALQESKKNSENLCDTNFQEDSIIYDFLQVSSHCPSRRLFNKEGSEYDSEIKAMINDYGINNNDFKRIKNQRKIKSRPSQVVSECNIIAPDTRIQPVQEFIQSNENPLFEYKKECKCAQILIVDDEPFNLIALEGQLHLINPDIRICKAFNGKEALEMVRTSFDSKECNGHHNVLKLIITDNNMPLMGGLQLSKIIKDGWVARPQFPWQMQAAKKLKLVLLTGNEQEISSKDGTNFSKILGKPINRKELKEVIDRHLK
ncbi:hypothetical protein FGO68_gene10371 [Halteria grandinella]|uniref:histidine kinase n=1 Tax=Halteria grandinella TaxID=5974 RepID=A0A8J8T7N2_HALGN|nr:hypothetical protein FGO68_gene10371 [Halteria grandinella]